MKKESFIKRFFKAIGSFFKEFFSSLGAFLKKNEFLKIVICVLSLILCVGIIVSFASNFNSKSSGANNLNRVEILYSGSSFETYNSIVDSELKTNVLSIDLRQYLFGLKKSDITDLKVISNNKIVTVDDYSFSNCVLKIDGNVFGNDVYGLVTIKIMTNNCVYSISNVEVITKKISTFEDLDKMLIYGGVDSSESDKSYNGYFVLCDNIDCNNTQFTYRTTDYVSYFYVDPTMTAKGFNGIFDGKGYSIYNIPAQTSSYGTVFGTIDKNGIVKNTAFVGVLGTGSWGRFGLVAGCLYGTFENCYIEAETYSNSSNSYTAPFVWVNNDAVVKDVVCKIDYSTLVSSSNSSFSYGALSLNGIRKYSFNSVVSILNLGSTLKEELTGITVYDFDDVVSFSPQSNLYWSVSQGQPIFKSLVVSE